MDLDLHLAALESQLLHEELRQKTWLIDRLLADNFREVAGNGAVIPREDVVKWLLNKKPSCRWQFIDFTIDQLSESVVLVTYQAKRTEQTDPGYQGSMHCSLWKMNGENWQMMFHQSTKIHLDPVRE